MEPIIVRPSSRRRTQSEAAIWSIALAIWFLLLCFLPNPRPLSAPEWITRIVRTASGVSEPNARLIATLLMRAIGLFFLGGLVSLSLSSLRMQRAAALGIAIACLLAIASMWFNYGYFPIPIQLQWGVTSSVIGVLAGIALLRSRIAVGVLVLLVLAFIVGLASIGISNQLDSAARTIGNHLLENLEEIPDGDEGFLAMMRKAFATAAEEPIAQDEVFVNKATILALGVILGDEKVAKVAKREIDPKFTPQLDSIRRRITLRGRNDLARHFWVSAALTVISNEANATSVGLAKEIMDSGPGGSGFSFVDLAADFAGVQFAVLATKNQTFAKESRERVLLAKQSSDFCPSIDGLPEGMTADQFQSEYGGVGGDKTKQLIQDIRDRLLHCPGLNASREQQAVAP